MRTKRFIAAACLVFAVVMVFSNELMAQPGRYKHRSGRYYPRYYPQRLFYYNQPFVSINFGNRLYRYQRGNFYRPFGASFQIVVPPFGIRIRTLPMGYRRVFVGGSPFYYYRGTYYRPYGRNEYQVVRPPLGATVDELPRGAKATVIDGKKYYESNGTYFEETVSDDNKIEYTVVGTGGVLNTTDSPELPQLPQVGDRFDALPADSKEVNINGQKLFLSPMGLYYKEVKEGKEIYYEVVGQ